MLRPPEKTGVVVRRCVVSSPAEEGYIGMAIVFWPKKKEQTIWTTDPEGNMAVFACPDEAALEIRAAVIDLMDQHLGG